MAEARVRLDHVVIAVSKREGARGRGTSLYFRDPDGSLLELISYERDQPGY